MHACELPAQGMRAAHDHPGWQSRAGSDDHLDKVVANE